MKHFLKYICHSSNHFPKVIPILSIGILLYAVGYAQNNTGSVQNLAIFGCSCCSDTLFDFADKNVKYILSNSESVLTCFDKAQLKWTIDLKNKFNRPSVKINCMELRVIDQQPVIRLYDDSAQWKIDLNSSSGNAINSQVTYLHCGYENSTVQDEIIQKVESGQPTQYSRTDTLGISKPVSIFIPKAKCNKITVSGVLLAKTEVPLILNTDFTFDCESYEFQIINEAIITSGAIVKINWFYRECSD
ncbi:MAG: hypothetical protein ABIQ40_17090 [Bacteroidia bacterium]